MHAFRCINPDAISDALCANGVCRCRTYGFYINKWITKIETDSL